MHLVKNANKTLITAARNGHLAVVVGLLGIAESATSINVADEVSVYN